jgi:hypothetical protein
MTARMRMPFRFLAGRGTWALPSALGVICLIGTAALTAQTPPAASPAAPSRSGTLPSPPTQGTTSLTGLAHVITAHVEPQWPVELSASRILRWRCALRHCSEWERLDIALERAAEWMAAFPPQSLRFDAAMALIMTRKTVDSAALRSAFERARSVADRDDDNPQRRFWTPNFTAPPEHTSRWIVPTAPGTRVNTNRVVAEALFCKENGWRPETMRYLCGPMRDEGGYGTTHALWALDLAHRNGCVTADAYEGCAADLQRELAGTQPSPFEPRTTLDIDLYAERLLSTVRTGYPNAVVDQWARTLLALQGPDGSWGVPAAQEDPYYRYHATMVATWALAEWYRRLVEHPELVP